MIEPGQILFEAWYFFRTHEIRTRSVSWFEKAAGYIGSFYDYYRASGELGSESKDWDNLIADCLSAFRHGTIGVDGSDPLGLMWRPWSASKADHATTVLRSFCRVVADITGDANPLSASHFAHTTASNFAREQKKFHSPLFHLASREAALRARDKGAAKGAISRQNSVKAFPKRLLRALLFEGCRRTRKTTDFGHPIADGYNITLMMAIALLAGGGLRKSEIFHIFTDDVRSKEIRLYDPVCGRISWRSKRTGEIMTGQRVEYLADQFQRLPRNRMPRGSAELSGWKSMLYDYGQPHFYASVQWISARQRMLFYSLYRIYRDVVLPISGNHPYLFISTSQTEFGQPWTIGAFNDAFGQALTRIGERADAADGLNPHGLRHLYGQTLVDMAMPPLIIQHAMHHKSIESQLVYTKPSAERVRATLEAASQFTINSDSENQNIELLDQHWQSDPLRILSSWGLGDRRLA